MTAAREATETDARAASTVEAVGAATSVPPGMHRLHVVIAGHVDHGKSSLLGRLLADTHSLPEGRIDQVRAACARDGRPFEYAFLADALRDERARGITMDTARAFLRTSRRHYLIHDAPGHAELLRNMVTGAARAEAAVLVVDAAEGMQENSRRHARMLAMLGVRQLCVAVNKMDLVGYDRGRFAELVAECNGDLGRLGLHPAAYVPVSARGGDNVVHRSVHMDWYDGPTLTDLLDGLTAAVPLVDAPLRIPVQGVYGDGEHEPIIAGMVESGSLAVGDEVVVFPSGARDRVRSIEAFNRPSVSEAYAGEPVGFTTAEQLAVTRGHMIARASEPPPVVSARITASIFWLGREPLHARRPYVLRLGTARTMMTVESVHTALDATDLATISDSDRIACNQVAECTLALDPPIALDPAERSPATGRFVILVGGEIRGGGCVRDPSVDDAVPDPTLSASPEIAKPNAH